MKFEKPTNSPSEEKTNEKLGKKQGKMEAERILSDARLRFEGAETQYEKQERPWLEATPKQKERIGQKMDKSLEKEQRRQAIEQERESQKKSIEEIRGRFSEQDKKSEWRPEGAFAVPDKEEQAKSLEEIRARFEENAESDWRPGETMKIWKGGKETLPLSDFAERRARYERKPQEKIEQKRNLSDIRLRLEGAEIQQDKQETPWLEVPKAKQAQLTKEMETDLDAKKYAKERGWLAKKAYEWGGAGGIGALKVLGKIWGGFKRVFGFFLSALGVTVGLGGEWLIKGRKAKRA